jgi:hypothetical protein
MVKKQVFKLSESRIQNAASTHRYIKADGNGDLMLTGASNYWRQHPTYIYVPRYRISGSEDDVRLRLREYGVSDREINDVISTSYTMSSVEFERKHEFEVEIERAKEFKKNRPKDKVTLLDLNDVHSKVKNRDFTVVSTVTKNKDGILVQEAKQSKRKGVKRNMTFQERVDNIEDGFVLDVSTLTSDGKGSKYIKAPTELSSKKPFSDFRLVSNSLDGMRHALTLLGHESRLPEFEQLLTK